MNPFTYANVLKMKAEFEKNNQGEKPTKLKLGQEALVALKLDIDFKGDLHSLSDLKLVLSENEADFEVLA